MSGKMDEADLLSEVLDELKVRCLPGLGHKELTIVKALASGIVRLIAEAKAEAVREANADRISAQEE